MIQMLDSIDVSLLPAGNYAYAGYVDGHWPTYNSLKRKFPGANLLSIAVFASEDADCLDIETGDATPSQAAAWFTRQLARGIERPCLYANAFTMREVIQVMNIAGIDRSAVRLWSAHYGSGLHVCGPSSCGLINTVADGTQWADQFNGVSVDQSILNDDFFGGAPAIPSWQVNMMNGLPLIKDGYDGQYPAENGVWFRHRIQSILSNVFGYKTAIDGVYGASTIANVKKLQGAYGLAQDGITGPLTWQVLYTGAHS
jgi:hypothetical protein